MYNITASQDDPEKRGHFNLLVTIKELQSSDNYKFNAKKRIFIGFFKVWICDNCDNFKDFDSCHIKDVLVTTSSK